MKMNAFLSDLLGNGQVSPGSLGGKLKRFREAKGLTQKQLGVLCGFKESTASTRIAQYEMNKKKPGEDMLKTLAEILGVDIDAFFDGDLYYDTKICHALFDLEDFHSLRPTKVGGSYYLVFGGHDMWGRVKDGRNMSFFLKEWYEKREATGIDSDEEISSEERKKRADEYLLWRASYSERSMAGFREWLSDQNKMDRLQEEIDLLYAKTNSSTEMAKLDKAVNAVLPSVKEGYKPIKKESELVLYVADLIFNGMRVRDDSPAGVSKNDPETDHLLSIPTEDILKDEESIKAYAYLLCMIEQLKGFGIEISRSITSKDKVLFISFRYGWRYRRNFYLLPSVWGDIQYIVERLDKWADWELDNLKENLRGSVTGDRDVDLPAPVIEYEE